jgi:peptide/nickel transport system substrate-binding protein
VGNALKALAVSFAAATVAAAGCSKVENGSQPQTRGVEHGVLRIVGIGSVDSLVPELSGNAGSVDVGQLWAAWLYRIDDRGRLEPELATDVPTLANGGISKDGLTIVYHLRRGVFWQDGAPFDARDVIFTWHEIMNPNNWMLSREGYDQIVSMTAPDPYTVIVRLRHPYPPAVASFFGPGATPMAILPAHLLAGTHDLNHAPYNAKPVGTGPFEITRYDAQSLIVLKANPHYWRGPPRLREIDVIVVPATTTREVMMRTGEADLYYDPPQTQVRTLETIPGVHVNHTPFEEFWYLGINESRPPLDDVRLRRAISLGVDRDLIIRVLAGGNAEPAAADQPSSSWAFDPNVKPSPFDPAGARRILDAAGWTMHPDGYRYRAGSRLSISYVSSSNYGDGRTFGPIFQQEMKAIGIDTAVKLAPTSILFAAKADGGLLASGHFNVVWEGWIGSLDPDDAVEWDCNALPPLGYNYTFTCDPRLDEQERIALSTYDEAKRKAAYWKIQELLAQNVAAIFLFWEKRNDAVRDGFENYRPAPAVTEFWNPWEWQT